MSTKRPWMPLYIDDFLAGTTHLTGGEVGAYILLIMHYWSKGGLPADENVIQKIARMSKGDWKKSRDTLKNFFSPEWKHERIEAELAKAIEKSRVNSANAARSHVNRKAPATKSHAVSQPTLQTPDIDGGGGDARAREAVSLPGVFVTVPAPSPSPLGVPVEHWPDPPDLHPDQAGTLAAFRRQHAERGTFSRDWDAAWRDFLRQVAEAADKPKKRTVAPRIETDRRPEAPPGTRLAISEAAFALAEEIAALLGVAGMPATVGWPAQTQVWLAAWPADVIRLAVRAVMAKRTAAGQGPPQSLKYFENAIARTMAEVKAAPPDASIIPPASGASPHGQGPKSKSVSDAARRLAEKFAARDAGGDGAGAGAGDAAGGPVPQIGCG